MFSPWLLLACPLRRLIRASPRAHPRGPSPGGTARAEDRRRSAVVSNRLRSKHIMTLETEELPLPTLNNSLGDDPVCSQPSSASFLTGIAFSLK